MASWLAQFSEILVHFKIVHLKENKFCYKITEIELLIIKF